MAIFNVGSINIDHFYSVSHIPVPGETLAATEYFKGLGGKGVNQSVAAALAGAKTHHVGAVGEDGGWAIERLTNARVVAGVDVLSSFPTGHANIYVDPQGENMIILEPGANAQISDALVDRHLADAKPGDFLVLQNETNASLSAAKAAKKLNMKVAYSAAPFDLSAIAEIIEYVDYLLLNQIEFEQLTCEDSDLLDTHARISILVTKGAEGAKLETADGTIFQPSFNVDPVDTTGAGDCFAGYFVAGLDRGADHATAMREAAAAAAIKVTRKGTSDVFPTMKEVKEFLKGQD